MEAEETQAPVPVPRRSLRRFALSEVNEPGGTPTKNQSPEERAIIQRGRRMKPITWSPLDYNRNNVLQKSSDKTPEKHVVSRTELISSRLKRRLILSPTKPKSKPDDGSLMARKLRMIDRKGEEIDFYNAIKYKVQYNKIGEEIKDD
ncbi:uncharacterized protein LOC123309335 [Coccinella septempunctata]|uniref:uncharacterized protein LOC123309335 n=1 Tax=Coccinella septempunctata TaxID=41139 RepID=UPI001D066722|nr:uncharacterized protein LOC123309335 [Coccinella septempunctata]